MSLNEKPKNEQQNISKKNADEASHNLSKIELKLTNENREMLSIITQMESMLEEKDKTKIRLENQLKIEQMAKKELTHTLQWYYRETQKILDMADEPENLNDKNYIKSILAKLERVKTDAIQVSKESAFKDETIKRLEIKIQELDSKLNNSMQINDNNIRKIENLQKNNTNLTTKVDFSEEILELAKHLFEKLNELVFFHENNISRKSKIIDNYFAMLRL